MKIIKYIAIGLCILFTISSGIIKFAEWSGLDLWLNQPAICTKGGIIAALFLVGMLASCAGWGFSHKLK